MGKQDPPAGLTDYQEAFCQAYVALGYNGAAAIESLGRKVKAPRKSAYELRQVPAVRERIAQLVNEGGKSREELKARVITRLSLMLDAELPDAYGPDGELLPMEDMPEAIRVSLVQYDAKTWANGDQQGSSNSIKLADKRGAAKDLARLLGMHEQPDPLAAEREQVQNADRIVCERLDGLRAKLMGKFQTQTNLDKANADQGGA